MGFFGYGMGFLYKLWGTSYMEWVPGLVIGFSFTKWGSYMRYGVPVLGIGFLEKVWGFFIHEMGFLDEIWGFSVHIMGFQTHLWGSSIKKNPLQGLFIQIYVGRCVLLSGRLGVEEAVAELGDVLLFSAFVLNKLD